MDIMGSIKWAAENWANILAVVPWVIAAAALAANLTPTQRDDRIVSRLSILVDWAALNFNVQKQRKWNSPTRAAPRRDLPFLLNVAIGQDVKDRLEELQAKAGGVTTTEVLKRALSVYDEALRIGEEGGRIIIEEQDGTREELRIGAKASPEGS